MFHNISLKEKKKKRKKKKKNQFNSNHQKNSKFSQIPNSIIEDPNKNREKKTKIEKILTF